MKNSRLILFRKQSGASPRGLCRVRSTGHYFFTSPETEDSAPKNFFELFWCVSGEALFGTPDGECRLGKGEIFCYFPGDEHHIRGMGMPLEYYWLALDGENADRIGKIFGFERGARHAGDAPRDLFRELENAVRDVGRGDARAGELSYTILSRAANPAETEPGFPVTDFRREVAEHFSDADFSVEEAARTLGIHRSTLARKMIASTGMTPVEYLTAVRMRNALSLLGSRKSVKETALASGFSDANYFGKAFRRFFGESPLRRKLPR